MGTAKNLHEIMNDVIHRLDCTPAFHAEKFAVLDELHAFMELDELLTHLHKQYLDAKQNRQDAEKEFGMDDGMTEMAMLVEDSAWCAMQTRLMEVREDSGSMVQAQKLIEESVLEEKRLLEKEKKREAFQTFEQMQLYTRMHDLKKNDDTGFWLFLWMLMMKGPAALLHHYPTYQFNRLAA